MEAKSTKKAFVAATELLESLRSAMSVQQYIETLGSLMRNPDEGLKRRSLHLLRAAIADASPDEDLGIEKPFWAQVRAYDIDTHRVIDLLLCEARIRVLESVLMI